MALYTKLFDRQQRAEGDEDFYYLARDSDSGDIFVLRAWSLGSSPEHSPRKARVDLGSFLSLHGAAQDKLRELIGAAVGESQDSLEREDA